MIFKIVSYSDTIFDSPVIAVHMQGASGEFCIMDGHENMISKVNAGTVRVTDDKKKDRTFDTKEAILMILDNEATLIVT